MSKAAALKLAVKDFATLRADFPILQQSIHGKPLVYLDSAASSQKPQSVITALSDYYSNMHSNVHRGVHTLSERATAAFEGTREKVRAFIHARSVEEIIFVSGATEGINLVAQTYGRQHLQKDDEVILSVMEHHSNIVPWQLLCEQSGAKLRVIPMSDAGELDLEAYEKLFNERSKLVCVMHVSNVLGTVNPIEKMISLAHRHGVAVLIDGAQALGHFAVDVQALDCDFYVFSSHKAYGPTGLGVLYAKKALLEAMPPYKGGGDMIEKVSFAKTTFKGPPYKFEAGTPNIAAVVAFAAALTYLEEVGLAEIYEHEQRLLSYATAALESVPGLRILGKAQAKLGVLSFVMDNIHPHDLGTFLDHEGLALRVGHHCAMPLMERLGVPATTRASFGLYTVQADLDALVTALHLAKRFFKA